MAQLAPFQRHLLFFADAGGERVTLASATRGTLRLGLNLPLALGLSLSIRALYTSNPLRPLAIATLPAHKHRAHLENTPLAQPAYTRSALLALVRRSGFAGLLDRTHVLSFWALAARKEDARVVVADVRRFQAGAWAEPVAARRRGRADVLPFTCGGPLWPAGHSAAVRGLFGVRVYERE